MVKIRMKLNEVLTSLVSLCIVQRLMKVVCLPLSVINYDVDLRLQNHLQNTGKMLLT